MAQFTVTGEEASGRRFDVGVIAYNEADAKYAAKLRLSAKRRGIKILFAERIN